MVVPEDRFFILRFAAWSAALALAILPLFSLPHPYDIGILLPMLILAFALASVWLVPLLAWVTLAGLVYVWLVLGPALVAELTIDPASQDALHVLAASAGAIFLIWFCYRMLRKGHVSALMLHTAG